MAMMKTYFTLLVCSLFPLGSYAQSNYRLIEKGNSAIQREQYSESEISYRKALEKDGKLTTAQYNIGNARYLQEDFEGSAAKFELSAEAYENKQDKAAAYHNLGNSLMSQKKYEESIEAYKNALKLNPSDMDTKYNLAYAQKMLKKAQEQKPQQKEQNQDQQEEQKNEQQEKDDKGDKKEEKEDKQKEDDKKDSNKDQEDKDGEKEKPQPPKDGKLTKEQADQILKMLESEEAKLQEKLDQPEGDAVKINIEKDW